MLRGLAHARHVRHRLAAEPQCTSHHAPLASPRLPSPPTSAVERAQKAGSTSEPALHAHSVGIGDQSKSGGASSKRTSRGPRQCAVWLMSRNLRRDEHTALEPWIGQGGMAERGGGGEGRPCDDVSTRLPGIRWLEFQKPDIEVLWKSEERSTSTARTRASSTPMLARQLSQNLFFMWAAPAG